MNAFPRTVNGGETPGDATQLIRTMVLTSAEITGDCVAGLLGHPAGTALVIGFVSPHCDFVEVAASLRDCVPQDVGLLMVSTAGELCGLAPGSPYCPTGDTWDRIVLVSYSRALFAQVAIYSIPMPNEDIRQGNIVLNNEARIARLTGKLKKIVPPFVCDYRDTFVLTFVDGLSHAEPHLLEAIYKSKQFPLYFVGGSSGGKFDFKNTYLFDGDTVTENHAVLCFVKLAPKMRYSIFKSQNFKRTDTSFVIADADPDLRIVRRVALPSSTDSISFVDAVAGALGCTPEELDAKLGGMTFGVEVGGELFVRSIAGLNLADGSASFYCDVDSGDCLYLLDPTDFVATTRADLARFLAGKPPPLGALLNDCILRRLNNADRLADVDAFDGINVAGFSTFGEMFGLNINQTLTSLFLFPGEESFPDDMIDRFPIHYASFCGFFDRRAANRLKILSELRQEQERIRRQLRREHEFSQALVSSLPGVFFLLDNRNKLILWNENVALVTGQPVDKLGWSEAGALFFADDRTAFDDCIVRALSSGRAAAEVRLIGSNGLIPYYITAHCISLDGERYLAAIGIDITDRKYFESALEESRRRLKMITDSLAEGVVVVNQAGVIIFANPAVKHLLECEDLGDLEGYPINAVFRLDGDNPGKLPQVDWNRTITENVTINDDDSVILTQGGKKRPVAYTCAPLREGGAKQSAVISFRDIQALKEAQRDMIQSSRLASVGQLAAGIAHEINTPIQYIGNNLKFIRDSMGTLINALETFRSGGQVTPEDCAKLDFLHEEVPVAVEESQDGIAQISRIVLSMKEFSHPGTKSKTRIDINRSIQSTLTVSRNVWKHVANVIEDFSPSLPSVLCYAGELNQVVLNLIVNAAHSIEGAGKDLPGTIKVSTLYADGIVEIRVEDSGTGIPDEIRDRIFDPFFTTKGVGKGTGQGLAICRDVVVTKHGGRLDVESRQGQGATFIVRLPVDGTVEDQEGGGEW